jgi:hypothetical protein
VTPYVHSYVLSVDPNVAGDLVQRIRTVLDGLELEGLLLLSVLVSDDKTHVAIISEWKNQHDWGRALWNERIQDGVVDLFRSAKEVASRGYHEVFRIPPVA